MKRSAGLLLHRRRGDHLQVLLVHPGGPFWGNKDAGSWTLPKGEYTDENPLDAARREFEEETGFRVDGKFEELGSVRQASGKMVIAWALEYDLDPASISSNTFTLEWPPRSGVFRDFPEVDRGEWFSIEAARDKILPAQQPFLDRLLTLPDTSSGMT